MAIKKDKRRREEEEEEERRGPSAPPPPAPQAPDQSAQKAAQSLVPPDAQEKLEQEQEPAAKPVAEPEPKNLNERQEKKDSQEQKPAATATSGLAARQSANRSQANTTAASTASSSASGKTPPPPPPPRAKRPATPQAPARRGNFQQKLAKLQELDTAGSTNQASNDKQQLTRLQAIAENVKHIVKARMGTENPLEVESRTDVKRFVKVAQTNKGEKLVINTDVYIPGRWFRRKQWRTLDQSDEDEFFLKSAGTLANKK